MNDGATGSARRRVVERVLARLESLPTPSPVVLRLLEVTQSEESSARDVIDLVTADPALSGRVLSMCRRSERGRALRISDVERAVVLMGFDAVRAAALSVQLVATMDAIRADGGEGLAEHPVFEPKVYWRHCLSVAVMSEMIARRPALAGRVEPGQAFAAGLLHDIGHLALHAILPRSFDRACEIAETEAITVDGAARRIIGLDGPTVGKRLAEKWSLPPDLVETVWLAGQPPKALPDGPHRDLVAIVSLADAIVSRDHVCIVGHGSRGALVPALCELLGTSAEEIDALRADAFDEVVARAEALGMDAEPTTDLLLRSVTRANAALARIAGALRRRAQQSERHSELLGAIGRFQEDFVDASDLDEVIACVARSAIEVVKGEAVLVFVPDAAGRWHAEQRNARGRVVSSREHGDLDERDLDRVQERTLREAGRPARTTAWSIPVRDSLDARVVVLGRPGEERRPTEGADYAPLRSAWGAAISSGRSNASLTELGERLAHANRDVLEYREAIARAHAVESIGAVAAGAAHEMNNPLAVVAGRARLLQRELNELEDQRLAGMAQEIVEQANRVGEMIAAMHRAASPIDLRTREVDLAALLHAAVDRVERGSEGGPAISVRIPDALPTVSVDVRRIGEVIGELVGNAARATPKGAIVLEAVRDAIGGGVVIRVRDDGPGLSERALQHAFDPFFSEQRAGRRPGLGLANVRRLIEAHGGRVSLRNGTDRGAVATIVLPATSAPENGASDWTGLEAA